MKELSREKLMEELNDARFDGIMNKRGLSTEAYEQTCRLIAEAYKIPDTPKEIEKLEELIVALQNELDKGGQQVEPSEAELEELVEKWEMKMNEFYYNRKEGLFMMLKEYEQLKRGAQNG